MTGRIIHSEPQGARLPVLGKIKVGEKVVNKNGKEYPTSTDYFISKGKYEELFREVYGEKPNRIQIVFISDKIKDVCDESYQFRDAQGRLLAEGDGFKWKAFNSKSDKYDYGVSASLEEMQDTFKGATLSTTLTLRFLLPKIRGVFGAWQFTTKGVHSSIPAIRDTFDNVQMTAGTVINIPFDLIVEKVTSQKPGAKSVFPVVSLIPNLSQENLEMLSEFVESGQRFKGVLTEERLMQLSSSNAIAQLQSHNEDVEETAVNRAEEINPPQNSQPTAEYLNKFEQEYLMDEMLKAGIEKEWIPNLLTYKGIESMEKFPFKLRDTFFNAIKGGQALAKAKELAGVK